MNIDQVIRRNIDKLGSKKNKLCQYCCQQNKADYLQPFFGTLLYNPGCSHKTETQNKDTQQQYRRTIFVDRRFPIDVK